MKIIEYFSTKNDCYKKNVNKTDSRYTNFQKNGPQGLMLHSVGCPQPNAKVFARSWNASGKSVAVHAVLQADGLAYQCMPWNFRGWHAGGNANNTHIGIEMTEPDCITYTKGSRFVCHDIVKARKQVTGTYNTAVELFAYLCKKYDLDPMKDGVIISHSEGHDRGIASGHSDPEHLWSQLGLSYTMDGFRKDVRTAMMPPKTTTSNEFKIGDEVKLISGAKYSSGESIPNWVFSSKLYVRELQGDNVVISTLKTGAITGVVNKKYLTAYKATSAFKTYQVQVTADALNIRAGAGTNYKVTGVIRDKGVYTIIDEKNGWGKLKSGKGWIYLKYTEKI